MLVVRGTKKLRDRAKGPLAGDDDVSTGVLGDWFAFGWWNCHLHEFEIGRTRYGIPDPDWDFGPPTTDERTTRLDTVAGEGASFHYTYDFGDDWRHKVTVEKVGPVESGTAVPGCIGGRRACPPEDCGGPWGYQDLLESLGGGPGASDARLDFVGPDFDPPRSTRTTSR